MARHFEDWLDAYLKYTSLSEAPEIFHFWTGVSTIAGAVRRRVWSWQDTFEWTPNFYIILVSPPGVVTKSTTLNIGIDLLREIEGVHFGPDSGTWQAISKRLAEVGDLVPTEKGNLDSPMETMSCITCSISELGTFLNFQDDKLMSVLTGLWDSQRGTFEHSTLTTGNTVIVNPWINIIAATTPYWLKQNAPETLIGGGFASRSVFVFGKEKRHLIAWPGLVRGKEEKDRQRALLLEDLKEISNLYGPMKISAEVMIKGEEWYKEHWSSKPIHMASERYGGYIARKQTHVMKLAIVLSLSRRSDLWILEEDFDDALKIMTGMEADMINVFESIGVTPMARLLNEILTFLWTYQTKGLAVSRQLLWRQCIQLMTAQEFKEITDSAVQAGYLEIRQHGTELYYRALVDPQNLRHVNGQVPGPH